MLSESLWSFPLPGEEKLFDLSGFCKIHFWTNETLLSNWWSPPTDMILFDICTDILSDIYSVMLWNTHSDMLFCILSGILCDILSGILPHKYVGLCWHMLAFYLTFLDILSDALSDIFSGTWAGIQTDILSETPSDILSDIIWHIFWHIFWHSSWHLSWHAYPVSSWGSGARFWWSESELEWHHITDFVDAAEICFQRIRSNGTTSKLQLGLSENLGLISPMK